MTNYENSINDQLNILDNNIKKVNNMDLQSGGIFGQSERRKKKHMATKSVKFQFEDEWLMKYFSQRIITHIL